MSKRDVLLAKHNFSELKSLSYNVKIRSSLKFPLIRSLKPIFFKECSECIWLLNIIKLNSYLFQADVKYLHSCIYQNE